MSKNSTRFLHMQACSRVTISKNLFWTVKGSKLESQCSMWVERKWWRAWFLKVAERMCNRSHFKSNFNPDNACTFSFVFPCCKSPNPPTLIICNSCFKSVLYQVTYISSFIANTQQQLLLLYYCLCYICCKASRKIKKNK